MRRGRGVAGVRLGVVVATMAAVLVPALSAPARTISRPVTLARTITPASAQGHARLAFPATHVVFSWRADEGTGVRFRTVGRGGSSSWMRAPEAHDAEHGDHHYSGVIAVDRPEALRWRSIRPPGARMGRVTIDYLNTLDGPRQTFVVPATASAAARTPDIITRAEWGADESLKRTSGGCKRQFYPVQQLIVHHTAGSNFDSNPAATMRAIYWYHAVRRGWCDVGYNFVIAPDGRIFEGRWARSYKPWETHSGEDRLQRAVAGAHASGFNSGTVGISIMGTYSRISIPPAARRSLTEVLAWEADRHDLDPLGRHYYRNPETGAGKRLPFIAGHRDTGQTECPGGRLYRSLDEIRRDTAAAMGAGKTNTDLTLQSSERKITFGESVTFSGILTDEDGIGLAGQPVTIYRRTTGAWGVGSVETTAVDGSFSFTRQPQGKLRLVAVYDGSNATWGSQSATRVTRVAPDVTLTPQGAVADPFTGIYHYPAGTTSVDFSGDVAPNHSGLPATVRVYRQVEDGTTVLLDKQRVVLDASSNYSYTFDAPDAAAGTYRALTWFEPKDGDHAAGRSETVTFVIEE